MQLRDQHRCHLAPAAQKEHDIAGLKGSAFTHQPRFCVNQRFDMIRKLFGKRTFFVAEPILFLVRRSPVILRFWFCTNGLKKLDHPDLRLLAIMLRDVPADTETFRASLFNDSIDEIKDWRCGPKTLREGKPV